MSQSVSNPDGGSKTALDLNHLRRDARTAVELAIVALAPEDIVDGLAVIAGLLEAISELPAESPPVSILVPKLTDRAKTALARWNRWHSEHVAQIKA